MGYPDRPFEPRLMSKVEFDPNSGCWLWSAALQDGGYGTISKRRDGGDGHTTALAHRVSYKHFVGPIPDNLGLDHKCRTRCCINPAHLEPTTQLENIRRSPLHGAAKTNCKRGHELPERDSVPDGRRRCRICINARRRERRAAGEMK